MICAPVPPSVLILNAVDPVAPVVSWFMSTTVLVSVELLLSVIESIEPVIAWEVPVPNPWCIAITWPEVAVSELISKIFAVVCAASIETPIWSSSFKSKKIPVVPSVEPTFTCNLPAWVPSVSPPAICI